MCGETRCTFNRFVLRPNMKFKEDYYVISEAQWDKLAKLYRTFEIEMFDDQLEDYGGDEENIDDVIKNRQEKSEDEWIVR